MSKEMESIVEELKGSDCEGTRSPWWFIIDPRQNFRCDPHEIASMITGPFFSRERASNFLKATRYNFGRNPVVYCASGCYSKQYDDLCRSIEKI
jgi:hypothetical protein